MQIRISKDHDGTRLRDFLRSELRLSSKMLKHLKFLPNGITVNGTRVTVRYTLCADDLLELAVEDEVPANIEPVELPLEILYEDADVVVPSKPANMPTHPSCDHYGDTVANALAFHYRSLATPFVFRPINRLDRNTSGLLLIARNRIAAGRMTDQMKTRRIEKTYLAVLDGELPLGDGVIDACLHRTQKSIILREVCTPDTPDAAPALTRYTVIAAENGHTLVLAFPLTGRTHQLRVHFASIGHPITGDDLYGIPSSLILRHALHAYALSFDHPTTAQRLSLTAPPPKDLQGLIEQCFPSYLNRKGDLHDSTSNQCP